MSDEELQAIRERVEKATPGPWFKNPGRNGIVTTKGIYMGIKDVDSHFIAHAREDVPALLAEIDRLRGLLVEK